MEQIFYLCIFIFFVLLGSYIFVKIFETIAKEEYFYSKSKYYDELVRKMKCSYKKNKKNKYNLM